MGVVPNIIAFIFYINRDGTDTSAEEREKKKKVNEFVLPWKINVRSVTLSLGDFGGKLKSEMSVKEKKKKNGFGFWEWSLWFAVLIFSFSLGSFWGLGLNKVIWV